VHTIVEQPRAYGHLPGMLVVPGEHGQGGAQIVYGKISLF
jgi:hypothetical protein